MSIKINTPVSVSLFYDHQKHACRPTQLQWQGQHYLITKLGYHHQFNQGKTLFHVYSVATPGMFFKLLLNTENLQWRLLEVAEGH